MEDRKKIQGFEDLVVWQEAQNLATQVYETTKSFPKEEVFGITNQIRRAVTSVSANIAEGFGRRTAKDKLQFYVIAYGSLLETKNFIYLSQRLGFIGKDEPELILANVTLCQKLLNAYMRPLK